MTLSLLKSNDESSHHTVMADNDRFHTSDLEMESINATLEENSFMIGVRTGNNRRITEFTKDFARELHAWLGKALKD